MKHIKKSMFISTVLMVVMLIAALSTATFAWYTSNNSVVSTATEVGAAKSQSANIGIGWYRTATGSTITFDPLVDTNGQGGMYPMVPNTFYQKMKVTNTATGAEAVDDTVIGDAYVTSPVANVTTGIIENAFTTSNSKRIINLPSSEVSATYKASYNLVKNKADYVHDVQNGKITNLTAAPTEGAKLTGNYDIVYTSVKYTYNNSINTSSDTKPNTDTNKIITIGSTGYTINANPSTACYEIAAVYTVDATSTYDTLADAISHSSTNISQMCAYTLTGVACNPGTFVVAYTEYNVIAFNAITLPTIDSNNPPTENAYKESITALIKSNVDTSAVAFVCYAANQADTANDGDIYAAAAVATYNVNANINWNNSTGFAYLYQIYKSTAPSDALVTGNTDTYTSFRFTESNVDANGFFKATDKTSIEPGAFWSGDNGGTYTSAKKPAVITTRNTKVEQGTETVFYVVNNGTEAEAVVSNLKVSLSVSGDNADLLRIAVFKNGKYYGTLGREEATHFGTIIEGANADDMPTYSASSQINLGKLETGASSAFEIRLIAWFDGEGLDDVAAGKNCSFTLSFEA